MKAAKGTYGCGRHDCTECYPVLDTKGPPPTMNPVKAHIDTAVLAAHAALARAAHSPREAIDILLDSMDELEKALDLLFAEEQADNRALEEVRNDLKKPKRKAA